MTRPVRIEPLTREAFAPYGDVLDAVGAPDWIINEGLCERFHDRARLDFGSDGRAGISIFHAEPRSLPLELTLLERHPDGSQAFIPMSTQPFLVIVAADAASAKIFGTEPGAVEYIRQAAELQAGTMDLDRLRIERVSL
mgnify:CR=1 FL=1